uniref:Uncharacterized protein n=1 Tax=Fagus sylvatica TaxID=28930 RepID=A0A2N9G347_FAGSY
MQLQQNPEAYQDSLEPPFDNHFAMLHLDQPCTTCASCHASTSNPMKRRSPTSLHQDPTLFSDSDSDSQPKPKKLFLDQDNQTHQGFSKLSLPFQPHSYPLLRRSISDPPQSPENAKTAIIPVTPSSHTGLPPLPPTLRRSVSDPNPSPVKTYSRSSSSGDVSSVDITKEDTPNSNSNSKKRLRRMKDCMREMSKWCEEIMSEKEDGEGEEQEEEDNNAATTKDNSAPEFEESVYVERVGEGLTVNFKCPCGKGYHILLSGNNCYYKLM